jgi:O-succinylbenzoic acid--CoA ligase
MKDDNPGLKQLSAVLLGGAPLPAALINRALARDIPLFTTYGLTEMGSQVTCRRAQLTDDELVASAGTTLPHRELSISDAGEILVRGKTLFAGYIVANTIEPHRDDDGWFHTRDLGRLTTAGELLVVGRTDAQFISGGENIHPEIIEAALASLPYIEAACVVSVADEEFGQRPYAFVVTANGDVNTEEILVALRQALPSFALPKYIVAAPPEMITASGKLNRGFALKMVKALDRKGDTMQIRPLKANRTP